MRILMSAYVCNPTRGSEAGVGWSVAHACASRHDVTLLTQSLERDDIEAALARDPDLAAHLRVIYVDVPGSAPRREGRGNRLLHHRWQHRIVEVARDLHRQTPFDVAHHSTFATDADTSGLTMVAPDLPTVWGPVGGATAVVPSLWPYLGVRGALEEIHRSLRGALLRKSFGEANVRRAALTVAANETTFKRFRRRGKVIVEPTAMLPPVSFDIGPRRAHETEPFRAAFAGRLVAWKGASLAISALAEPEAAQWVLDIYGEGPEEVRLRDLAQRLGVSDRVLFCGLVPREELLKHLADADALLFPSLREQTGWVVAEALAVGTPVVCIDRGGPPALLQGAGPDHGFAVAPGRDLPKRLAEALAATRALPRVPSDRWSISRMPDTLDRWYALAIEHARAKHATNPVNMTAPRITDSEIEKFAQDGCLIVNRPVISEAGITEASSLINGVFDRLEKVPPVYVNDMGDSLAIRGHKPTIMPNLIFCVDMERKLMRGEAFLATRRIAEQLLGGPVRYEFDQVILKPPYSPGVIPWHTDLGYKRHPETCPESVDLWISMQDTTVDMGSMRYIPGSQNEVIEHDRVGGPTGHVIEARGVDESRAVYAPLCRGGVSMHGLRTLHGSGPNTTDRTRLAWIVHFARDDRGRVRRYLEERFLLDSIVRSTAARLLPIIGPILSRVEKILLRRGITI